MMQIVLLFAAFWVAVFQFRRHGPEPKESLRFVLGLGLGAVLAHLVWALLNLPQVIQPPWAFLDPTTGFTVLAVPLGLLVTAAGAPGRYLSMALASLPLTLATARVGCLFAGCCHGTPLPFDSLRVHPTSLYEIVGLLALHYVVRRAPARVRLPLVLGGLGGIRLLVEPFRAAPPLGEGLLPAWLLAAAWLGLGLGLALRASRAREGDSLVHLAASLR